MTTQQPRIIKNADFSTKIIVAVIGSLSVAYFSGYGMAETEPCRNPSPVERLFVYQQGHCDG
jgi:hypothetical protein